MRTRLLVALSAIAASSLLTVACGDDESTSSSSSGEGGTGGTGATTTTSVVSSTSAGPGVCTPGEAEACYEGASGTLAVGACQAGTRTCDDDGFGFGPCVGQIRPADEQCGDGVDQDCDGEVDELDGDCACVPGTRTSCYDGPSGTEGQGLCAAGEQRCDGFGGGLSACIGQVLPQVENCATPEDEDCDGLTPACEGVTPIVDLRGDVDRDGAVSFIGDGDDAGEQTWTPESGAIFLANLDDDLVACPNSGTDAARAACHDAANSVIDGEADLADLARLETAAWAGAPDGTTATLVISPASAASKVRLFRDTGAGFVTFDPATTTFTAQDVRDGLSLAIEANDIARNGWDGLVDVTWLVEAPDAGGAGGGGGAAAASLSASDTVRLRVAPLFFRHHLDPATRVYATRLQGYSSSTLFRNDLQAGITAAGVPDGELTTFDLDDQWTQDFFETGYMAMPGPDGLPHVIHVNVRSANHDGSLREGGRVVFGLRGPDVAALVQFDPQHSNYMDTLNSFGNTETVPPFSHGGRAFPHGRVLRGATPDYYPDRSFDRMIDSQDAQLPLYLDTEWLIVGHVDETVSFVPADNDRGWTVLVADPVGARAMFEELEADGNGDVPTFENKQTYEGYAVVDAERTVSEILDDVDVMNSSAWATAHVGDQLAALRAATGVEEAEMVPASFLFEAFDGYLVAYQPGTVNGIWLSSDDFGAPKPHGPVVDGKDVFEAQLEDALAPHGVSVHWIENWNMYHINLGEVHCGSNVTRAVDPASPWWAQEAQ